MTHMKAGGLLFSSLTETLCNYSSNPIRNCMNLPLYMEGIPMSSALLTFYVQEFNLQVKNSQR